MNIGRTLGNIGNTVVNTGINVASAAVGGTIGAYVVNHDVLNDQDLSLVAGAATGVGTFCVTRTCLYTIKNGTVAGVNRMRTALQRKPKRRSTK